MVGSLRGLGRYMGMTPTLSDALEYLDTTLDELLKRGLWSRLLADAGLAEMPQDPDESRLTKGLRRLWRPSGSSAPYTYLGPCDYISHEGSRPISIVWRLRHAVPVRLFRVMARQNVG